MARRPFRPSEQALGARDLLVERLAGSGPSPARALVQAVEAVAAVYPESRLTRAGDPPRPIEPTEAAMGDYLERVYLARTQAKSAPVMLSSAKGAPSLCLTLVQWSTLPQPIDVLRLSLPSGRPPLDAARVGALAVSLAAAFGGHRAWVQDYRLGVLYRGRRNAERGRAEVPPHLRQYIPDLMIDESAGSLPEVLLPEEFDRRRVPDAVWWINVWDHVQCMTLGYDRVQAAEWASSSVHSGGMLLVATEEPTDARVPAHVEKLARIVRTLELRALQDRHRR